MRRSKNHWDVAFSKGLAKLAIEYTEAKATSHVRQTISQFVEQVNMERAKMGMPPIYKPDGSMF